MVTLSELLAPLPPEPDEGSLWPVIQQGIAASHRKLVVIDDDPTGTQTVHDVELLTAWNVPTLIDVLRGQARLFYVLINSRSLPEDEAVRLNCDLARQLHAASQSARTELAVASRSDSTLRGHYPAEVDALTSTFTALRGAAFDGHLIVPAFFEGGRYTINNTHYVATPTATADTLVPAHETPFARDPVFGYSTAYLPDWVAEKSTGRWRADQVVCIGLELIRKGGPEAVADQLQAVEGGMPVVINAAGYGDLAVVVAGLLRAEAAGKRFIYRTAASFVRLRGAVPYKPLLSAEKIMQGVSSTATGGIVIVGSYVPDSSKQLENVLRLPDVAGIELPVERIVNNAAEAEMLSRGVGRLLNGAVKAGRVGVIYTSRKLVTGSERSANLAIGQQVSHALVTALSELESCPRFIIAKGGITSHDVAQKALGAVRARVLGQLFPGVPVWVLESGSQLRCAGVPYIVFPGNVGGPASLMRAVKMLAGYTHEST
jgi:uncharacterized protein YgbK (DUF1537 family)